MSTLVLDLDKTLLFVHLPEEHRYGEEVAPYTVKRPGLEKFMETMAKVFKTIVVFSAAPRDYVEELVRRKVDPSGTIVAASLCGDDMVWMSIPGNSNKRKVKDLGKLGTAVDISKLVWVDDTPDLYPLAPLNGILVTPFKGDSSDQELLNITPLLLELANCGDVPSSLENSSKRSRK